MDTQIHIPHGEVTLPGDLIVPDTARGLVVFAHGTGSSRLSPRNRAVAAALRQPGEFGTLLFDLLTPEEDVEYANRFQIGLLTDRLEAATRYALALPELAEMPVGYFGASTGAAAAIGAAVQLPGMVRVVVSRGGRPDLAGDALARLRVPSLFIVGGLDGRVIAYNEEAFAHVPAAEKRLTIVPGATHLFEEPGAIEQVAEVAVAWFNRYLAP